MRKIAFFFFLVLGLMVLTHTSGTRPPPPPPESEGGYGNEEAGGDGDEEDGGSVGGPFGGIAVDGAVSAADVRSGGRGDGGGGGGSIGGGGVPVRLAVYDLSHGWAKVLSPILLCRRIELAPHTSIIIFGKVLSKPLHFCSFVCMCVCVYWRGVGNLNLPTGLMLSLP